MSCERHEDARARFGNVASSGEPSSLPQTSTPHTGSTFLAVMMRDAQWSRELFRLMNGA